MTSASPPARFDYVTAKNLAASPEMEVRRDLAAKIGVPGEILYFLAEDIDPAVRARVAANPDCPAKGNLLLADDPSEIVRSVLAAKIGGQGKPRKGKIAAQILDRLTQDRVVQVRAIIAQAIRDFADIDPAVINRLARDADIIVAAPILECSPVLTDLDLLDIIAGNPVRGALSAISRRAYVDPAVTSAIVATNDSQAITQLLKNGNAHLQENVLDLLIEKSVHQASWQEPLVYRPELNLRSALRLAELVAVQLLDRMLQRKDLPAETIQAVAKVVGERLRQQADHPEPPSLADSMEMRYAARLEQARTRHAAGQLDEIALLAYLLTEQSEDLFAALAVRSGLPVQVVLDMIDAQSPRALCALAWAAGLSALFAQEMQMRIGGIPLDRLLRPNAEGLWPLQEAELRWQVAMFDGKG